MTTEVDNEDKPCVAGDSLAILKLLIMTDTFRYKDIAFRRAGFTDSNGNEETSL